MLDFHDSVTQLLHQGIHERVFPGAVWATGNTDAVLDFGACGRADPTDPASAMRPDMLFDVASLTKILAVWTVIGTIWHDGKLPLDDPLATIWPEVADYPLGQVTARQLLSHTAGLPLRSNLKNLYGTNPRTIRDGILREQLHRPPGEAVEYTNRAGLILGFLAEHLTATPLERLATERIWKPLGMTNTRFGPLSAVRRSQCAPTELDADTGTRLKGVVHDYSARLLGGACGSAGVFSTLPDLARFLQHLLRLDLDPDRAGFGPAWLAESLQVHTGDLTPPWGLFWFPPPGQEAVYVHYGFTGTGLWLSVKQGRWAVMLTNKLYYSSDRAPLMSVRGAFRAAVFG